MIEGIYSSSWQSKLSHIHPESGYARLHPSLCLFTWLVSFLEGLVSRITQIKYTTSSGLETTGNSTRQGYWYGWDLYVTTYYIYVCTSTCRSSATEVALCITSSSTLPSLSQYSVDWWTTGTLLRGTCSDMVNERTKLAALARDWYVFTNQLCLCCRCTCT